MGARPLRPRPRVVSGVEARARTLRAYDWSALQNVCAAHIATRQLPSALTRRARAARDEARRGAATREHRASHRSLIRLAEKSRVRLCMSVSRGARTRHSTGQVSARALQRISEAVTQRYDRAAILRGAHTAPRLAARLHVLVPRRSCASPLVWSAID